MAATDKERREVARRLRELDDSELQVYDMTYFAIQSAVGGGVDQYPDGRELADRLADLIEPSEPQVKRELKYRSRCDELGAEMKRQRDALLKLADEMDMDAGCHAYVDDYDVYGYARRIRDALSVSAAT